MKKLNILSILAMSTLLFACNGNDNTSSSSTSTPPTPSSSSSVTPTPSPSSTTTPTPTPSPTSTPIVITSLAAPVITVSGKTVSWAAVEHAEQYRVYVDNTVVDTISALSYTVAINGSAAEKAVVVEAVLNDIVSPKSNEVKVTFTASEYTDWTKEDIIEEWEITGQYKAGVGEGFDMGGGRADNAKDGLASIANVISVTEETKILSVKARLFNGQEGDNTHGAQLVLKVNGTVVKAAGYETDEVTLPLGTDNMFAYNYDLTAYVGKTVAVELAQVYDEAYHCVIPLIEQINKTDALTTNAYSWSGRDNIAANWIVAGNYRDGVREGFDVNSYDNGIRSSITRTVGIDSAHKTLSIVARMFSGQDGRNDEETGPYRSAHMVVRVNGAVVRAAGMDTDYSPVTSDTDSQSKYSYDLSAFVDKTVSISISEESGEVGHMVLQNIDFNDDVKAFSTEVLHYYNKNNLADTWTLIGPGETFNEGFALKCEHDNYASLTKTATITAATSYMAIAVRSFPGDNVPTGKILVNGQPIKAMADENDTFTIDRNLDWGSTVTKIYDLSAFVGKTVLIKISNVEDDADRFIIRSVSFTGASTKDSWTGQEVYDDFAIAGDAEMINEGINVKTWDNGIAALYNVVGVDATKAKLQLNARMFAGQDGAGTESDPYKHGQINLFVNGTAVAEATGKTELNAGTDDNQIFTYDLAAYAGETVMITIAFTGRTGHNVIQNITFVA